jgi:periplasmic divalent cation tolerance protein
MNEYCVIYTTFSGKDDALRVIQNLISERLIACGNIVENMTAVYSWKGKIEQASEVIVFMKTKSKHYDAVEKRIKELHSYEVPCIFKMDMEQVFAPYAKWINEETKE